MAYARPGMVRVSAIRRVNREDLLRSSVRLLALLTLGFGTLAWLLCGNLQGPRDMAMLAQALILPVLAPLIYRLNTRPAVAGAALILLLLLDITACYAGLGLGALAYFYAIPALVAAVLVGPWAGPSVSALGLLAIAVAAPAGSPREGPAFFLILCGAFTWAVLSEHRSLLEWSWRASADATYLAEELRDHQGELNRTVASLDLTNRLLQRSNHELALARQEADEARRLKSEFSSAISHELRTPLSIILGFTEVMHTSPRVYGDAPWPPMLRRDVAEIHTCARYLADMVNDILDLARMEAVRMPIRREPTPLRTVIEEAAEVGRRLLGERPVRVTLDVPAGLPDLLLDRARIRQVLINLLTNAIRFTERGEVVVSAVHRDQDVLVTVTDTGIGIPPEQLAVMFDEYRQVGQDHGGDGGGKGLGLAIAKRFVQLHGGSLWAESEVGVGSAFHFCLPLVRKDFARLGDPTPSGLPPSGFPSCLAVYDGDEWIAESAAAYLRRHLDGFEVVPAWQPADLLALVESRHPQAIVANNRTGQGDALPEGLPATVPVIACALPLSGPRARHGDFAAFLTKPFESAALLLLLRGLREEGVIGEGRGDVLVADDDRGFVQLILRLLQAAGDYHGARAAYTGEEALRKIRQRRPGVLLLDMSMPGLSGPEVVEAMRGDGSLSSVPIIAMSGVDLPSDEPPANRVYLSKPAGLREGEVMNLIRAALGTVHADYAARP